MRKADARLFHRRLVESPQSSPWHWLSTVSVWAAEALDIQGGEPESLIFRVWRYSP